MGVLHPRYIKQEVIRVPHEHRVGPSQAVSAILAARLVHESNTGLRLPTYLLAADSLDEEMYAQFGHGWKGLHRLWLISFALLFLRALATCDDSLSRRGSPAHREVRSALSFIILGVVGRS
jgi:hypothetical protein